VLLSGAGHAAHAAEVATPLAQTAAGQRVTALFESILNTAPTGQQMAHWVHALRSGIGANVLRWDLTAKVMGRARTPAPVAMNVVVSGESSGAARRTGRADLAGAMPAGLSSAAASAGANGLDVRQVPVGWAFTASSSPGATPTSGTGNTGTTTSSSGSTTGTSTGGTMSSGGTTPAGGTMSSGGTTTPTGGTTPAGGTMSPGGTTPWWG
jgi:hypothetical protein